MLDQRMIWPRAANGKRFGLSITSKIILLYMIYSYTLGSLLDLVDDQLSLGNLEPKQALKSAGQAALLKGSYIIGESKLEEILIGNPSNACTECSINYGATNNCNNTDCSSLGSGNSIQKGLKPHRWLIGIDEVKAKRYLAIGIKDIKRWLWWFGSKSSGALWIQAEAIRLVRIEAPSSIEAGQPVRLRCIYETRGDKLQSLSWSKNGREFYRYQPYERRQPVLAFNYTGITVDLTKSRNSTVFLTNTTSETSGRYKCEATATTFQEVNMETYVTVSNPSSAATSRLYCSAITNYVIILSLALASSGFVAVSIIVH